MDIRTGYSHADDPFRDPSRVGVPPFVETRRSVPQPTNTELSSPLDCDRITYLGLHIVETTLSPFQIYRFSVLRGLISDDIRRSAMRNNTIWTGRRPRRRLTQASLFAHADMDLLEALVSEAATGDVNGGAHEILHRQPHLGSYIDGQRIMFDPAVNAPRNRRAARETQYDDPLAAAPEIRPTKRKRRRNASRGAAPTPSHFAADSVFVSGARPAFRHGPMQMEVVHDVDFVVRQSLGIARPIAKPRMNMRNDSVDERTRPAAPTPARRKTVIPTTVSARRGSGHQDPPSHFQTLGSTVPTSFS